MELTATILDNFHFPEIVAVIVPDFFGHFAKLMDIPSKCLHFSMSMLSNFFRQQHLLDKIFNLLERFLDILDDFLSILEHFQYSYMEGEVMMISPALHYKVRELHIDLLLLEEFYSSDAFVAWFLNRTLHLTAHYSVKQTNHSVYELERESDLEILFEREGKDVLFLIENKINASFQANQAEDYTKRAAEYVRRNKCDECYTVLFAPAAYIELYKEQHVFHFYIAFEQLIAFFEQQLGLGRRAHYKSSVLKKGIEKFETQRSRSGNYAPSEVNQGITSFWYHYWQDATERYPQLSMPKPGEKGPASTFIGLGKNHLPSKVFIYHKFVHGSVDLQFEGMKEHAPALIEALQPYIEPNMTIQRAGKAAVVVRIPIEPINPHLFYDEVRPIVWQAQDQAMQLLDWFMRHQGIYIAFCEKVNN